MRIINTTTVKFETGKVDDNGTLSCLRNHGYEIKIMQDREVADDDEEEEDDDVNLNADDVEEKVECTFKHMLNCLAAYQEREYNEKINVNTTKAEKDEFFSDPASLLNKNLSLGFASVSSTKQWIFPMVKNLEGGHKQDFKIELVASKKQEKPYAKKTNCLPYYNIDKLILAPYGKDVMIILFYMSFSQMKT